MLKGMPSLELKTKIDFYRPSIMLGRGLSFNYDIPLLLKDGSILLYDNNSISLLPKNLKYKILFTFERYYHENETSNIIRNIKQLKCGNIFCCNKQLYVFNDNLNNINPKLIHIPNNENLFDIIELKNKKLLGITLSSILEFKKIWNNDKKEEEYEINCTFKIPEKYIETPKTEKEKKSSTYIQYIDLHELYNNKLLIHSYSTQLIYGTCGTHPPDEFCRNKIFIFDLNNNEIIHSFEPFNGETNIIILDKYICVNYYNIIEIYDPTNFKLLKIIKDHFSKDYMIKYDENIIIGLSGIENENDIILYNLININDIRYIIFRGKYMKFIELKYNLCYPVRRRKNKSICLLNNNCIFIVCHRRAFIVKMKEKINSIQFHPLEEIEYTKEEIEEMNSIEYVYF